MNLHLQILLILRDAGEHLLPMSTLIANLRLVDREESLTEIRVACGQLEAADEIIGIVNPDTGAKWRIADKGRARLAGAGL